MVSLSEGKRATVPDPETPQRTPHYMLAFLCRLTHHTHLCFTFSESQILVWYVTSRRTLGSLRALGFRTEDYQEDSPSPLNIIPPTEATVAVSITILIGELLLPRFYLTIVPEQVWQRSFPQRLMSYSSKSFRSHTSSTSLFGISTLVHLPNILARNSLQQPGGMSSTDAVKRNRFSLEIQRLIATPCIWY